MELKEQIAQKLAEIRSIELAKRYLSNLEKQIREEKEKSAQILLLIDQKLFDLKELEKMKVRKLFSTVLVLSLIHI